MNLETLSSARVCVIGDQIIDRWIYGTVSRVSPEAPVPVVKVTRQEEMPGGAGNVAANLRALGCEPSLFGQRINPPVKVRIIGNGQQVARYDIETTTPITPERELHILEAIARIDPPPQAMVLSDYGKGVLTSNLCCSLIALAREREIPVVIDPKGKHWRKYWGATVITPNAAEFAAASEFGPLDIGNKTALLITQGADGMTLLPVDRPPTVHIKIAATGPQVIDVTGAGDSVVAVVAAALAVGYDLEIAARLANAAAGVVVGKSGTATCSLAELEAAWRRT